MKFSSLLHFIHIFLTHQWFLSLYDSELAEVPSVVLHSPDVKREIMMLSIPAIAGQALDPLAQLMETTYIGRLGSLELGSAGVSVNIFNYISKLFNIPLLSVANFFVAEVISRSENNSSASVLFQVKD
ncbi:protein DETOXIFICATION 45, chloroplastic-like [Humulus lupulus]|uniref:protein DETOXIFICATION 45, chloroplastic-like n=1 Tax=Humulus lupulus TaxID=3486 RepID=UPI002B413A04|nr:protein DETOXIFICATION 45, chloroplastic-like [Humulus lupulus]